MRIKPSRALNSLLVTFMYVVFYTTSAASAVVKEGDKIYIVDRTGERWEISQAVSTGFDPHRFEFGIGRYAFQTLDESHWSLNVEDTDSRKRIIGVSGNGDAHAYSVEKLRYHETANTFLGSQAIVTGY